MTTTRLSALTTRSSLLLASGIMGMFSNCPKGQTVNLPGTVAVYSRKLV